MGRHVIKSKDSRGKIREECYFDYHVVTLPHGPLKLRDNGRVIKKRADTFFNKEPKTLEWINKFKPNSVMVDIGANIGVYSLYAASLGHKVYAFEPQALNYAELCINIFLNSFQDNITAYNIGLSDSNRFGTLQLFNFVPGQSSNTVASFADVAISGARVYEPNQKGVTQGCVVFHLDYLYSLGVLGTPKYVKIDVDGLEPLIIKGGLSALSSVDSILVEVANEAELTELFKIGFKIVDKDKLTPELTNYILEKA
jgi:FkbM family methyltransferase